ncbi:hypothetical protein DH2020_049604 [Rehmannia glutinosa]|uniref:Uncharacterized protein n=1 Tax=Rehmannia glutinosa TaxID=99300 RepID=A0ABR0U382_REHGL
MKRQISTSRVSGQQTFESVSTDSKHGSTLVFEDNSKCHEADMHSSKKTVYARATSVKSDLNVAEDGLNTMAHDSQHRTESSCSTSLSVNIPVSFSSPKFPETSKEAYSFRNCGGSMDSSNSKAFDCSPDEPVTASSESGVSAQIARKAIRNARAKNSMKISSMVENRGTWLTNEDEEFFHENGVAKSSVCSDISDNFYCTSKTVENVRSCDEHDNLPSPRWGKRMINHEISESSMTKTGKVSVNDDDTFMAEFDLNEDIYADGMDDVILPVVATVSSHSVIHVVAKPGIPNGRPMIPLKFEGGLGFKSSIETSAFRPAALSKMSLIDHKKKNRQCFTGIDLNVAVADDNSAVNGISISDSPPNSEVDSKHAKSHWIDLNCSYNADEFTQPSLPLKSENFPLIDLNLNVNASIGDKANEFHWQQSPGNKTSDSVPDFNFTRHDYLPDLSTSTMQHLANNAPQPIELMQRLASLQPKLPFLSHTLPQSYRSKSPLHFGTMPYARYSRENDILAGILGANHFVPVFHEQGPSNVTTFATPKLDVKTEDSLSTSGSKMDEGRQFLFLAKNSPMSERVHEDALYATSMKRKEPEGGLEFYQLGYKQVT